MGRLMVNEFMTLDGVAQAPGGREEDQEEGFPYGGWQAPLFEPDSAQVAVERAMKMDALLLGRRTYDIFANYWPNASPDNPFTKLLNEAPKYVASRTLGEPLAWSGSNLLKGDLAEAIADLKQRYDEIHVIGSLNLVQTLLQHELIDELNLWVYPLVLGKGKRVFADGTVPTQLRLVDSVTTPRGTLQLTYQRAGKPTFADMG